jgi:hypothetical protein
LAEAVVLDTKREKPVVLVVVVNPVEVVEQQHKGILEAVQVLVIVDQLAIAEAARTTKVAALAVLGLLELLALPTRLEMAVLVRTIHPHLE